MRELHLLPHQEIEFRAHYTHDLIISIGGVGSGKTTSFVLWLLDRMRTDTAQTHALFAVTTAGMRAVTKLIYKQFARMGLDRRFNKRPPKEWVARWEREGIKTPVAQDRYENMVIWSNGLHLQLGTLGSGNFEQYRGAEWGSIGIEEFTLKGVTQDAVEFLFERTRCGDGDDGDCGERLGHRHTKVLHGNPPESPDHWVYSWLDLLEETAKAEAEEKGAALDADPSTFPHLHRGIGSAILIPSKSEDNLRHLPKGYIRNQMLRLDAETAQRRLGGSLVRTKVGRAYDYSRENEIAVDYDRSRTLYVGIDFNNRPLAATLCHPLKQGEFPGEHAIPGISHIGQFGEVFDVNGGGLEALCALLLSGNIGSNGHAPPDWLGLLEHKGPVKFFGDSTGLNKTAAGPTLWDIVENVIGSQLRAKGIPWTRAVPSNPIVPLRVRAHNAKLRSAAGIRSFWIDPRCHETILDYMMVVWDKTKPDVQKYGERGGNKNWLRTHLSDANGYMLAALFPMGQERGEAKLPSVNILPQFKEPQMR